MAEAPETTFLMEEQPEQANGGARPLSARRAPISVDAWVRLKKALDFPPARRKMTHCIDIEQWVGKVGILRQLKSAQRQNVCKWLGYRAVETKQRIFSRGQKDDGMFYIIFSGTVAVLTPPAEKCAPPRPAPRRRPASAGADAASVSFGAAAPPVPSPPAGQRPRTARSVLRKRERTRPVRQPRPACLRLLSSGDSFGELGMLEEVGGEPGCLGRTATVEAQTPCMLLTLPRERFLQCGLGVISNQRWAKVRTLQTNQLFSIWTTQSMFLVSYFCTRREFQAGEVIIDGSKGPPTEAHAVVQGSCVVTVDGASQLVAEGYSVGADTAFAEDDPPAADATGSSGTGAAAAGLGDGEPEPEPEPEPEEPRCYHVVADGPCVTYAVPHQWLQTLVPAAARSVLDEVGRFRLKQLAMRHARRRVLAAARDAEKAQAAEQEAVQEAGVQRTREAWIAAQQRAVELRLPSSSMGASPHMLLNTETAMRDLQRSERRAHHAQLSHAPSASSDAEMEREAARQAVRSVQKLQSLAKSLKSELVQFGVLLAHAELLEMQRFAAAVDELVSRMAAALSHDPTLSKTLRKGLTWRKVTAERAEAVRSGRA